MHGTSLIAIIFIAILFLNIPNAMAMRPVLESQKILEERSQDQRRLQIFCKYLVEIEKLLEKHETHEVVEIISNMLIADLCAKPGISRKEIEALFNGLEAMGISLHKMLRIAFEPKFIALKNRYQKRIEEISELEKKLALEHNILRQEIEIIQNQIWDIPCIDGIILKAPFKIIVLSLVLKNQVEQNGAISIVPFHSLIIKKLLSYLEIIENSSAQHIEEQRIIKFFTEALASDHAVLTAADILRCKYMIFNSSSQNESNELQRNAWTGASSLDEIETGDKNRNKRRKKDP